MLLAVDMSVRRVLCSPIISEKVMTFVRCFVAEDLYRKLPLIINVTMGTRELSS